MNKYLVVSLSVLATIFAQISLKKGMTIYGQIVSVNSMRWIELLGNVYLWIGGILYVIAFLLYLVLLSRYELSRIYPITTGLAFVSIAMLSNNMFREELGWDKLLGLGFVLLGITFLGNRL